MARTRSPPMAYQGAAVHCHSSTTADALGAEAYATQEAIAFREAPDLHLAAHEAAHIVQQRAGLALPGGMGHEGDAHERAADAIADRVVRGEEVGDLLPDASAQGSQKVQAKGRSNKDAPPLKPVESGDVVSGYVVYKDVARKGGSLAWRDNNPGNLIAGSEVTGFGAFIGKRNGKFAIFPTEAAGMSAIRQLLVAVPARLGGQAICRSARGYVDSLGRTAPLATIACPHRRRRGSARSRGWARPRATTWQAARRGCRSSPGDRSGPVPGPRRR